MAVVNPGGAPTPVEFFTLVFNGMPFLPYHLEVWRRLKLPWRWHVVEGAADLVRDTAWSVPLGGRLPPAVSRWNAGSSDGSWEYLQEIQRQDPQRILVYPHPKRRLWRGKVEMVRRPLPHLAPECLLWQVDVDEFWTAESVHRLHDLFQRHPDRTAAFLSCEYFIGPRRHVVSQDTWATGAQDWLRVWKFRRGMRWKEHEPPRLVDAKGQDVGKIRPFSRDETRRAGISFQHFAYALESQVQFKENYYGYKGAVEKWKQMVSSRGPLAPDQFLPWAQPGANSMEWDSHRHGPNLLEQHLQTTESGSKRDQKSVDGSSSLAVVLRELILTQRPRKIVETGTFRGCGTSSILAGALEETREKVIMHTIEVNPKNHRAACRHFRAKGWRRGFWRMPWQSRGFLQAWCGLSLKRSELPSRETIRSRCREAERKGLYVDFAADRREEDYGRETAFRGADDLLRKCLRRMENRPDLVLLDSAGHVGWEEFQVFCQEVKSPCWLVLDDVFHVKHDASLEAIRRDPRFQIHRLEKEKFGYCIARFEPVAAAPS